MGEIWTGKCLCGECRFEFRGPPQQSGFCHCNMCKRATGGAFAVLAQVRLKDVSWTGRQASSYRSSPIATRGFCRRCGTPLYLQYDGDEVIRFTAGCLDNPEGLEPSGHYGVESRLAWADIAIDLPAEKTKERW